MKAGSMKPVCLRACGHARARVIRTPKTGQVDFVNTTALAACEAPCVMFFMVVANSCVGRVLANLEMSGDDF